MTRNLKGRCWTARRRGVRSGAPETGDLTPAPDLTTVCAGTSQPGQMLAGDRCLHPYRKRPIAREVEQWTNFLPDVTAASAILDRILHHCEVVVLNGDSYRLRQAKGVVRPKN